MSKGRANYSMKLANYDFVPNAIEDDLKKGFVLKEDD
jgi:elongation factor G